MQNEIITTERLKATLAQFTGTEHYHRHSIDRSNSILLTDGCKYLADAAQCYWLFDAILSHQNTSTVRANKFQVWKLIKHDIGGWELICQDGNNNELESQEIGYSDFPLDRITIWLVHGIAMLPKEY